MGKAETLERIRGAEAQIRAAKETAAQEREAALRSARREVLELLETFRGRAETRYREIVGGAEAGVISEREKMLGAAGVEAGRMTARGKENLDRAVDLVVEKFRGAIRA